MKRNFLVMLFCSLLVFGANKVYSQSNDRPRDNNHVPQGEYKGDINGLFKIKLTFDNGVVISRKVDDANAEVLPNGHLRSVFFSEESAQAFISNLDSKYKCSAKYRLVKGFYYVWIVEYSEKSTCWWSE